jgi:hypothetical protein
MAKRTTRNSRVDVSENAMGMSPAEKRAQAARVEEDARVHHRTLASLNEAITRVTSGTEHEAASRDFITNTHERALDGELKPDEHVGALKEHLSGLGHDPESIGSWLPGYRKIAVSKNPRGGAYTIKRQVKPSEGEGAEETYFHPDTGEEITKEQHENISKEQEAKYVARVMRTNTQPPRSKGSVGMYRAAPQVASAPDVQSLGQKKMLGTWFKAEDPAAAAVEEAHNPHIADDAAAHARAMNPRTRASVEDVLAHGSRLAEVAEGTPKAERRSLPKEATDVTKAMAETYTTLPKYSDNAEKTFHTARWLQHSALHHLRNAKELGLWSDTIEKLKSAYHNIGAAHSYPDVDVDTCDEHGCANIERSGAGCREHRRGPIQPTAAQTFDINQAQQAAAGKAPAAATEVVNPMAQKAQIVDRLKSDPTFHRQMVIEALAKKQAAGGGRTLTLESAGAAESKPGTVGAEARVSRSSALQQGTQDGSR